MYFDKEPWTNIYLLQNLKKYIFQKNFFHYVLRYGHVLQGANIAPHMRWSIFDRETKSKPYTLIPDQEYIFNIIQNYYSTRMTIGARRAKERAKKQTQLHFTSFFKVL